MRAKLVVIGDSFVEGRGDETADGRYHGWVPVFAELLGIDPDACRNCGEHLATTAVVRDRQLGVVRAERPVLAGMVAGFNDVVGDYRSTDFRDTVRAIFADIAGHATTGFTATYVDVTARMALGAAARAEIRRRTEDANTVLRTASAEFGLVCLDVERSPGAEDWSRRGLWSSDGIHPNRRGYLRFADELARAVADGMGLVIHPSATSPRSAATA